MINVALPKGRLGDRAYEILAKAGFECPAILEKNRKLVFENPEKGVRYFWVKPWDVGVYVERGAADVGICGRDILLENRPDIYELVDLGIGKCRMCVAGPADFYDDGLRTLRVATKFPNIATDYYEKVGRDIDIIKLNGSIEIAPILGLSDVIVDIVETGNTLRENHLAPLETVLGISARFVCNKISFQFKHDEVMRMKIGLEEYVAAREAEKAEGKA
ncbi:ATP phosphoribosyltransferase [[Clostridium] aminophilum]|uniref:ATP phosphoribosyltransferase n=1 Tax=[Clostridium] aminophilum TaxID=1526 RepID=UPI0033324200